MPLFEDLDEDNNNNKNSPGDRNKAAVDDDLPDFMSRLRRKGK